LEDLQMKTTTATRVETLVEYYGLTYRVIGMQLEGVTHEASLVQPPYRGNCLNWVLGHIIVSREEALTILGEGLPWDESVASRYQRNSDPITSAEQALPFPQLRALLDESQSRILAGLARLSPERMDVREGDDTDSIGERLTFANWHETYHVGQLEFLRQLAGKNDKVI
jgi:DinB superfamily